MASLKERLNDNEYKFWIKAGLCLNHAKEGIETFTDDRSKRTHACVKTSVGEHAIVKTPDGDIKALGEICNNAKFVKRGNRWSLGCCNDCEIYVKEIAQLSQPPFRVELSNWRNSEIQLWPSEPWEIAKVYMNKGQRPFAFQKNSQETDLSGLLNFIDHCRIPWVDIQNKDNITKVRDARNATMHSASMKMSSADFLAHTDAMIALLQDPLFMDKIEEAQNAVNEIQKIVQIDFVISATDEFRILTDKTSSLQEQNDRLQDEVNALKIEHTDLENTSAQSDETTRILVKKETNQREAAIDTLKAEISEKENQLKEILVGIEGTARSVVGTETGQREAAINNLKKEISEKEKQLKEIIIEIDETARSLVKTETGKREAAINNLKAEISEKEKQLKELSTELMLVKKLINKDRNLYRKMDIRVSNVETCCDKTATELKEVKHSHQGLVEKVQRIQHEMQIGDFSILDSKNRTPLDEVQLLNEKLTETQHELWCRNKELEEYRLSTVSENNIIVQDKTNLLTAEKAKKELAVANEKLTAEVKQLQSELRQTKEHDIEKECTNTTCTSRIEALEYSHESLKSENESLRSTYDMKRLKANSAFEERNYNLEVQLANAYMDKEKSDTFIEELQTMNTQKEKQIQGLSQDINKISTEKDSLNVKKAELEVDLRKKEDEYQCLMQENTDLKATGEDLLRKLTTSHQHVVDLERKLSETKNAIQNFEQTSKESTQEMDKMKSDLYKLNNSHEEVKQHFSEAHEKITSKTSECNRLEHTVEDLQRRLETTEKQLSSQNEKSKQSLEVITQLKQERDELAGQVKQISSLTDEREQMISRQQELESTIKELQRKIEVVDKSRSAVAETAQKKKEELQETQSVYEKLWPETEHKQSSAEERPTGKPRRKIKKLSVRKSRSIEIKDKDDKEDCYIMGMALTHNGTILLADWKNSNIKSVSPDSKVLSVLSLPSSPRAITVLNTTTAVAAAINNKLYIINITDNKALSLRSESQLDYYINAMVAYNGNLAVTRDTRPRTTQLITIDGRVLWSVYRDTTGQDLFHYPFGITITSITDTTAAVVVSDMVNNTLTLLEAQTGTIIRSIDLGEWKEPWSITTDSDGNVYVCYHYTDEIGVWSADFQESKILLSGDKVGKSPCCIVYSAVNNSLYVSCSQYSDNLNKVDSFRLV